MSKNTNIFIKWRLLKNKGRVYFNFSRISKNIANLIYTVFVRTYDKEIFKEYSRQISSKSIGKILNYCDDHIEENSFEQNKFKVLTCKLSKFYKNVNFFIITKLK